MISRILLYSIELYRSISRAIPLPVACRFWPSCSFFTQEAIRAHGAVKGSRLGIWRILRCNPWNPGGFDPVQKHRK